MDHISLSLFEKACYITCSSVSLTERNEAEKTLYLFISDWNNINIVLLYLKDCQNEYTFFVICEYLNKIIISEKGFSNFFCDGSALQIFYLKTGELKLISNLFLWLRDNLIDIIEQKLMVRGKGFLMNSITNLISQILRILWNEVLVPSNLFNRIIEKFMNINDDDQMNIIGAKIFDFLVTNVMSYSYKMGYVQFRRLMLAFQNEGIPIIILKIIEIIGENFEIKENNIEKLGQFMKLFYNCLSFNFNMSFYEFETELLGGDGFIILYPDKLQFMFKNLVFYNNLFLLFIDLIKKNKEFSIIVLRVITKYNSARYSIFETKQIKNDFILITLTNLIKLLDLRLLYEEDHYQEIIDLNIRFLNSFGLRKIVKYPDYFNNWIENLTNFTNFFVSESIPQASNPFNVKSFELWRKILKQTNDIKIDVKISEKINFCCLQVGQISISTLIHKSNNFLIDLNFTNYKKFRKILKTYFICFHDLLSLNLVENLLYLDNFMNQLTLDFYSAEVEQINRNVSTIVIVISIINHMILNTNINNDRLNNYELLTNEQNEIKGHLVFNCIKLIEYGLLKFNDKNFNSYFELVQLCFIDQFLCICLEDVEKTQDKQIICKSKIYQLTNKFLIGFENDFQKLLNFFCNKLLCNTSLINKNIISFSIDLLKGIFLKLKRYLPREIFKRLEITQNVSNSLININSNYWQQNFKKIQSNIYEIIAVLLLDDQQDNYFSALDNIYNALQGVFKKGINKITLEEFCRNAIGITNSIDSFKIYRVFIKLFENIFKDLFNKEIIKYYEDQNVMRAALDLIMAVILNKSQRISSEFNSNLGYQIFGLFSSFLIDFTHFNYGNISKKNEPDSVSMKYISKLFKIFSLYFKGKYVNFTVFHIFGDDSFLKYFQITLDLKIYIFPNVLQYPTILEIFIENLSWISEYMFDLLFSELSNSYPSNYFNLLIQLISHLLRQSMKGITNEELIPNRISSILFKFISSCLEEKLIKFSNVNIEKFINDNYENSILIAVFLFEKSLELSKNLKIFMGISSAIYSLWCLFPDSRIKTMEKIRDSIENNKNEIELLFDKMIEGLDGKLDSNTEEKFFRNLQEFVKYLEDYTINEKKILKKDVFEY